VTVDNTLQLDVAILGRDYRIACKPGERDALMEAVAHLDTRMREIRDSGKVGSVERIAVMAALNIANDLLRERKESRRVAASPIDDSDARRRIQDMQSAIDKLLAGQEVLF
jgi:cell division protein ZapA